MERFKFRVWNNKKNEYEDDLYYEAGDLQVTCVNKVFEEYISDGCIIEQCTGLKDKNGKLIYENDLIMCPSGIYRIAVDDFGLWTAIYNNNPFKGVVEWSDMVKAYALNQENVELEVLGNVHENADLLGEE